MISKVRDWDSRFSIDRTKDRQEQRRDRQGAGRRMGNGQTGRPEEYMTQC